MIKKIISSILLITLTLIPCYSTTASASGMESIGNEDNATLVTTSNYNKLHFYFDEAEHSYIDSKEELASAMNALKERDEDNVIMAINDSSTADELYITVEFASEFTQLEEYKELMVERDAIENAEDDLEFRQKLNELSGKYYTKLMEKNLPYLSVFKNADIIASTHMPFVNVIMPAKDLTSEALTALCSLPIISHVSVSYELITQPNDSDVSEVPVYTAWDDVLSVIGADDVVKAKTFTGDVIKIGVLESGGVCDTSHENLTGKSITKRSSSSPVTEHATAVTSIIALMAPNADFYIADASADLAQLLAWFISAGCSVINCSLAYHSNTSYTSDGKTLYREGLREYRYDVDALFDYVSKEYFITICVSAGNTVISETDQNYNPNSKIMSPGYAYNAITVGGVKNNFTMWSHSKAAAYITSSPSIKPNVSAPYYVNIPGEIGEWYGTSFSTPLVTGCVALLQDAISSYRTRPHRVMSTLMATATTTGDYGINRDTNANMMIGNFDQRIGAGIVNLSKAFYHTQSMSQAISAYSGNTIINKEITLDEGEQIQIALSWLITNNSDGTACYVTNYDLRLYGPSQLEEVSQMTDSNVELIRYTATERGTYRIMVVQWGNQNSAIDVDELTLSYDCNK